METDSRQAERRAARADPWARRLMGLAMLAGCGLLLWPFLAAIVFAIAIAVASWPAHRWLSRRLNGRPVLAAAISCLCVTLMVLAPTALLMLSLRDASMWLLGLLDGWRGGHLPPFPEWIGRLPMIGEPLRLAWEEWGAGQLGSADLLAGFADPARRMALASAQALGSGLLQALVCAAFLYLLYRDGEALAGLMKSVSGRVGGRQGVELLDRAHRTVNGVMLGVVGAALAQASIASIGFMLAGVPNPFLLGALTFVLSLVPVGPPLIWGGAAIWLMQQGHPAWAAFMLAYGLLGISSIDNVVKPILISRSSRLPFAVTLVGVIGGVIAFGVAGVLLGPLLLALTADYFRLHVRAPAPAA